MNVPKDFLGRDIAIGATVVYPVRQSSHMWLTKARVVDIKFNGKWTLNVAPLDVRKKRIGTNVPVGRTVVV